MEQPMPAAHSFLSHVTMGSARLSPLAVTRLYQGTLRGLMIQPSMDVPLVEPVVGTTEGWMGMAKTKEKEKEKEKDQS
jgi:hypothetical protein